MEWKEKVLLAMAVCFTPPEAVWNQFRKKGR